MICNNPDYWCCGKEYDFDDTVQIDIFNEYSNKKSKWTRYAHARCILKMLKKACSDYDEFEELDEEDDFYELKKMIVDFKKQSAKEQEIEQRRKSICPKCKDIINPKFNFEKRGYYEDVNNKTGHEFLCQKCYNELKKPFVEIKKLETELEIKKKEAIL
jgi:hypothetical protein